MGGQIAHYHNISDKFMTNVRSVRDLVNEPVQVIIAPNEYGFARG